MRAAAFKDNINQLNTELSFVLLLQSDKLSEMRATWRPRSKRSPRATVRCIFFASLCILNGVKTKNLDNRLGCGLSFCSSQSGTVALMLAKVSASPLP